MLFFGFTRVMLALTLFYCFFQAALADVRVPLVNNSGMYAVPVRVNDVITLNFMISSGADGIILPADVVLTLLRAGTVKPDDFLPGQKLQLADGSMVNSERLTLKFIEVGGVRVENVTATILSVDSSPMLGQGFLSHIPHWSVDNIRHELVLGGVNAAKPSKLTYGYQDDGTPDSQPLVNTEIDRNSAEATSEWVHNGQLFLLESQGNHRRFIYKEPSQVMSEAGVTPGTVLFEGERRGKHYTGTARVFSKYCSEPLLFPVSGDVINEQRVILSGKHAAYGAGCKALGHSTRDVLIFDYRDKVKQRK